MAGTGAHRSSRRRRLGRFALLFSATMIVLAVGGLVVQAAISQNEARTARNVKNSYQIKGVVEGQLAPGGQLPVKIQIANNKSYPLWIYRLKISAVVDHKHRLAGCKVDRDYSFTQIPRTAFPFRLNKRKFRVVTLKGKVKGKVRKKKQAVFTTMSRKLTKGEPKIEMNYLPNVNQDACKGATIHFKFDSRAEKTRAKATKLAQKEKR